MNLQLLDNSSHLPPHKLPTPAHTHSVSCLTAARTRAHLESQLVDSSFSFSIRSSKPSLVMEGMSKTLKHSDVQYCELAVFATPTVNWKQPLSIAGRKCDEEGD